MKKIMFNDKCGLTEAVLEGRKTMTRRSVPEKLIRAIEGGAPGFAVMESKYKVGEVVAVAQAYRNIMPYLADSFVQPHSSFMKDEPGWTNKMFVKADLMPHQIRIINVRVERLQDISDKDCQREGITTMTEGRYEAGNGYGWDTTIDALKRETFFTPRAAFAALIDKVSGKGTWESNPWVFVYEFELL